MLPSSLFVNPIQWSIDEQILEASTTDSVLPGCLLDSTYVPRVPHLLVIESVHSSLDTSHPGTTQTLSPKNCYWWPGMTNYIHCYIQGCQQCAISKVPCHLPPGKLLPLPVPQCPWSHLGMDFTDLPASDGYTWILVNVDRFSKACKLIPLISGCHPQSNGQTERKVQEISCILTFFQSHQDSWSQFLACSKYDQNFLRQSTTGLTPFQCKLGFQPLLSPCSGEPSDVPSVIH